MRVVVTHVPAGAGHQRAAEAVAAAFAQRGADSQVRLLDALDGADRAFRWAFTNGYLNLVEKLPWLWGALYGFSDQPLLEPVTQRLHRLQNSRHGRALEGILLKERPDVVIGTHFFPMEVAGHLKSSGRLKARLITVITDYMPHVLWLTKGTDLYVVGSAQGRQELIRRGIPQERIRVTGIPIDLEFARHADETDLRRRLGVEVGRLTILIGAGGAGTGPVIPVVRQLERIREPLQLLVVAGTNEPLRRRLEEMKPRLRHAMKVYGFIHNMEELMAVSDLMVTKPGGLSCAEALAKRLPLILLVPVPGQESRNARFLCSMGAAVLARRVRDLPGRILELRTDSSRLEAMREQARALSFPEAALQVAGLSLE